MKTVLLILALFATTQTFASHKNCDESSRFEVINSMIDSAALVIPTKNVDGLRLSCDDTTETFMTKLRLVSALASAIAEQSMDSSKVAREREALRQAAREFNAAAGKMLLIGTSANFFH